jgi:PAS domain S-box-containing protein
MPSPGGGPGALLPGTAPPVGWSDLARHGPDGLAVVDADGLFVQMNPAAIELCGRDADDLIGMPAPFRLAQAFSADAVGLLEDGPAEQVCTWAPVAGVRREFAYQARPLPGDEDLTVVAFRDVTDERHRQRRVAALARTSAKLASEPSITATLDALAHELLQADALAGVQILTVGDSGRGLQIMGTAGFRRVPDFFERLMECRARGAELRMIDALERREPVVVAHRWESIRADPAWEPLHEYLGELKWDSFASVPLMVRGRAEGVLNAFFTPGQVVGRRTLEFLLAMAEQAAVAVDYASLLQKERALARREERQRLARDLHDSIVQHVFSIGMQAESISVLGGRGDAVPAESVRTIAAEIGGLARTVLADLRAMVHELRPASSAQHGLDDAVRALVASTVHRTGLQFDLHVGEGLEQIPPAVAEDAYRIVAEAIHNVVKHAEARTAVVRLALRNHRLTATVADDGVGCHPRTEPGAATGYGLTSMRERAQRWGGEVTITPLPEKGTSVRAVIPLPVGPELR